MGSARFPAGKQWTQVLTEQLGLCVRIDGDDQVFGMETRAKRSRAKLRNRWNRNGQNGLIFALSYML